MSDSVIPPNTQREWEHARRAAFVQDILGAFSEHRAELLPFDQVRHELRLREVRYLGLQDVPLAHIVGSVDRYQDFTRAFFPRDAITPFRWREVARLAAVIDGRLPPIEVYKVGDAYFVRDGNHRVSVARARKFSYIPAYVWEYETRVPVGPDITGRDLLLKAAYAAFLESTNVDQFLCDDMRLELTDPQGYQELQYEIEAFRHSVEQIDERPVPVEEAVGLWCEMCYVPIVETIRQQGIMQQFPGRTEADLYLWLRRNQEELEARYEGQVLVQDAAENLAERFGSRPSRARRVTRTVGRVANGVGKLGSRLVRRRAADVGDEGQPLEAALLASVRQVATTTPRYRFQGRSAAEWRTWHDEFRAWLWDVLGVGGLWQPWGPAELDVQVAEQAELDGVTRELLWLRTDDDLRVPAYLFRPAGTGPRPAAVIFPGHGTIDQAGGLEESPQQANALELAKAGLVTLALEPRGQGRLGVVDHVRLDRIARLVGRTWYGLVVNDGLRAIDYLRTLADVDPERIGVAGLGAGGAAALYAAALDDRVQAAVIGACLGRYLTDALDESHCPCGDIPGVLRYAEMGDVAALIAPRPALFVNGQADPGLNPGARESFALVRHVYQVLEVARSARLIEPDGLGHEFDNELAINWLRRWLGQGAGEP